MPAKAAKPMDRKTVKLTIPISVDVNTRLYDLSRRLGCGKSELAGRLLDQGLVRYQSDRRARAVAADQAAGEGSGGDPGLINQVNNGGCECNYS